MKMDFVFDVEIHGIESFSYEKSDHFMHTEFLNVDAPLGFCIDEIKVLSNDIVTTLV